MPLPGEDVAAFMAERSRALEAELVNVRPAAPPSRAASETHIPIISVEDFRGVFDEQPKKAAPPPPPRRVVDEEFNPFEA